MTTTMNATNMTTTMMMMMTKTTATTMAIMRWSKRTMNTVSMAQMG
jgi:hypothetical protein